LENEPFWGMRILRALSTMRARIGAGAAQQAIALWHRSGFPNSNQ
jgi:hypothetical protein